MDIHHLITVFSLYGVTLLFVGVTYNNMILALLNFDGHLILEDIAVIYRVDSNSVSKSVKDFIKLCMGYCCWSLNAYSCQTNH